MFNVDFIIGRTWRGAFKDIMCGQYGHILSALTADFFQMSPAMKIRYSKVYMHTYNCCGPIPENDKMLLQVNERHLLVSNCKLSYLFGRV